MTIGKQWPSEEVPESGFFTYPDGLLTVRVKSQEDGETRNGKYTIKVETRVLAPARFKNQPFNFQFVIGSDSDPEADDPETWKQPPSCYAASRYKSFLKACGVPNVGDTDEEAQNTPQSVIVIDVGHHDSDGKVYNDCNAFYSEADAAGKDEPAAPAPAAAQRAATNGKGGAATQSHPAAPKAPVRPAPKKTVAADAEPDDWN
jgi:hypothetical protein